MDPHFDVTDWFYEHKDDVLLPTELNFPSLEKHGPESMEFYIRSEVLGFIFQRSATILKVTSSLAYYITHHHAHIKIIRTRMHHPISNLLCAMK